MSAARPAECFLCGGSATVHDGVSASLTVDCPTCGSYDMTTSALDALQADPQTKVAVRKSVRRRLDSGVEHPRVDLDMIKALTRH